MKTARRESAQAKALETELSPPFHWRRRDDLKWIEVALPAARAVFSTRDGGISEGPYRSLNLGIMTDDDPGRVTRNRKLLAAALERDASAFAIGLQVHGTKVQRNEHVPAQSAFLRRGTDPARADAQVTSNQLITPLVLVADCVPLVLSAPGAVGVVHCGWRGVAAGLVRNAVAVVCELAGSGAETVSAAIGPAIGPCCYEVGEEVRDAFQARGHEKALGQQGRLDLPLATRDELTRAGLGDASIRDVELCTSCRTELFFSHRRDGGITGRQAALAWLT